MIGFQWTSVLVHYLARGWTIAQGEAGPEAAHA